MIYGTFRSTRAFSMMIMVGCLITPVVGLGDTHPRSNEWIIVNNKDSDKVAHMGPGDGRTYPAAEGDYTKQQCIDTYERCKMEGWRGPCGDCLLKCVVQKDWDSKLCYPKIKICPKNSCE